MEADEEVNISAKKTQKKKAQAVSSAKPMNRKQTKESELSPLDGQIG